MMRKKERVRARKQAEEDEKRRRRRNRNRRPEQRVSPVSTAYSRTPVRKHGRRKRRHLAIFGVENTLA
eukprot:7752723-Pyramimonas_sp.AAC.1